MAQRTNLTNKESPIKYILGSVILLVVSVLGIIYLTSDKDKKEITENLETAIKPTEKIIPTTEIIPTTKVATVTATISKTATPTAIKKISVTPSVEELKSYENKEEAFAVKYEGKRKLVVENEDSGKRYVFSSPLGNITVHVGKSWSWVNSGRDFTDKLLVGGEKSYVYEISNQKIVDVEKGDKKYTIQCVHNGLKELKTECEIFLKDFKFI